MVGMLTIGMVSPSYTHMGVRYVFPGEISVFGLILCAWQSEPTKHSNPIRMVGLSRIFMLQK